MKMTIIAILLSAALSMPAFAQEEKAAAAQAAVEQGNFDEAVNAIGEPQSNAERYWLGRALVELKRYDEAEPQFRQMVEADANDANAYEGLARVFLGRKAYREAVGSAEQALELNGESAAAYYVRGVALAYLQDYTNSANSLQKSLELNPNNGYAYYQLGMIQYRQKRYDQTIRNFQKFIEMMPDAAEAPQVKAILKTIKG
jgi:tetratricopeptide (TPR) repeat protein